MAATRVTGRSIGCSSMYKGVPMNDLGGTSYWLRSRDEEKRVVMGLYNRYFIRCRGVDGRVVWDIPGIPDFTDARWQAARSDGQIARIILEGRGPSCRRSAARTAWKKAGAWPATSAPSRRGRRFRSRTSAEGGSPPRRLPSAEPARSASEEGPRWRFGLVLQPVTAS
jgi:hypothetical protein